MVQFSGRRARLIALDLAEHDRSPQPSVRRRQGN
jgi:hypothetical protein